MPFWTYMLHCRGGLFYVGHTDDLDRRIGDHKSGLIPGFTADHQPVELVWSDEFQTRDDAKAVERKLKGWPRAKKLALIRGDLALISALAKKKDSASTSSAQTALLDDLSPSAARPELVEGPHFSLLRHPDTPSEAMHAIKGAVTREGSLIHLRHDLRCRLAALKLPLPREPWRSEGLWEHTCFEAFIATPDGYAEFNFSPSGEWAAYDFSGYRTGMADRALPSPPEIECDAMRGRFTIEVRFDPGPVSGPLALSAVIEEMDGRKSYWALAHPPGKPDFHHAACFAAMLPAARLA